MSPKAPPGYKPNSPQISAPPVYRPQPVNQVSVQPKTTGNFMLETRPAPPVYRPQRVSVPAQPKPANPIHLFPVGISPMHSAAQAALLQYGVNSPNLPGNGFRHRMNAGIERSSAGLVQKKAGPTHFSQPSLIKNAAHGAFQPRPPQPPRVVTGHSFGLQRSGVSALQTFQQSTPLVTPVSMERTFQPNLSVLQLSKRGRGGKKDDGPPKKKIYTRILHPDQLARKNIGINSVRRSERSLSRNLPDQFTPFGNNTSPMSGLYTFMRKYGGAGFMGFHTDPGGDLTRAEVVRSVLSKMRSNRVTRSSRGPKFAIVAIDPSRLSADSVLDLSSEQTRGRFLRNYSKYSGMYDRHAKEGVVAISDSIPRSAVIALRAFRDVPKTEEEMQEILEQLMAEVPDEHESVKLPSYKKDDFDPDGGGRSIAVS